MKRITILILSLILLGTMAGCAAQEEDLTLVYLPDGKVEGTYTGEAPEGVPQGTGSFLSEEGWSYTGSFIDGAITDGEAESFPLPLRVGAVRYDGLYSGSLRGGIPVGNGVWTGEQGSFRGSFSDGTPMEGTAENFPLSVRFGEESLYGLYTGPISAALPEGEGRFVSEAEGRHLRYEGGFAAGAASGEGTLFDNAYVVAGDRGCYEGTVQDGLPGGSGSFTARSSENVDYCYTGEWNLGRYEGEGELLYDSELYYERRGSFTDGRFTPTSRQLLAAIGSREPRFTLSDSLWDFISEYPSLCDFDHKLEDYRLSDFRLLWNQNITYRVYASDPVKYQDNWLLLYNYMVLSCWTDESFGEDYAVTHVLACNTLYEDPVEILVFGEAEGLDTARIISSYAVPLGTSSYTNETGEAVDCLVVLAGAMSSFS